MVHWRSSLIKWWLTQLNWEPLLLFEVDLKPNIDLISHVLLTYICVVPQIPFCLYIFLFNTCMNAYSKLPFLLFPVFDGRPRFWLIYAESGTVSRYLAKTLSFTQALHTTLIVVKNRGTTAHEKFALTCVCFYNLNTYIAC